MGDHTALHATPAGVALLEDAGFVQTGWVHQHQGTVYRAPLVPLGADERIRPINARDEPALGELFKRGCGMPRSTVLKQLMKVAQIVAIDRYGELIGFAALRKFGHGYVIGPVRWGGRARGVAAGAVQPAGVIHRKRKSPLSFEERAFMPRLRLIGNHVPVRRHSAICTLSRKVHQGD